MDFLNKRKIYQLEQEIKAIKKLLGIETFLDVVEDPEYVAPKPRMIKVVGARYIKKLPKIEAKEEVHIHNQILPGAIVKVDKPVVVNPYKKSDGGKLEKKTKKEQILELHNMGLDNTEIAEKVGTSKAAVYQVIYKANKPKEGQEGSEEREKELLGKEREEMHNWRNNEDFLKPKVLEMWDEGKGPTPREISKELRCSVLVVDRIIEQHEQEMEDEDSDDINFNEE